MSGNLAFGTCYQHFLQCDIGLEALYTRSQHNKRSKLNGAPEGMDLDQEVLFINVFRGEVTF